MELPSALTPRRSVRPHTAKSPPRRIVVANPGSRFTTPSRPIHRGLNTLENASITPMDVDDTTSTAGERASSRPSGETIYAKSEQFVASFYANLPVEVKQVLKTADYYRNSYTGNIDTVTGFALVASFKTCFVWQHAQALRGTPTCYIFTCPRDSDHTSPPFHGLIPYGSTREPGLILLSVSGEIRLWDSIGIGLAGGENYSTFVLELEPGEQVTNLFRSDAQTFVASTSKGSLWRLTLQSTGGRQHLSSHRFAKPAPSLSLSRLLPSFLSSSSTHGNIVPHAGNVRAIALGKSLLDGLKEIWALVDTRVQRWELKADGWEDITLEEQLGGLIGDAVREASDPPVATTNGKLDLECVNIAIDSDEHLIVLVSYSGAGSDSYMSLDLAGRRRNYAIACLSYIGDHFTVESFRIVPYQSAARGDPTIGPRMQLLFGGALVSIQFAEVVALCARDSDYRDRLELKSTTDQILGIGVVPSESLLLVLTGATMMRVRVSMDKVAAFDPQQGQTHLIKSTMTQAILYGASPENPLNFSFPPDVDEESLMQAAEQLSDAVLHSDPEVVRKNHDLTAQLVGRKERLTWLIHFINDNAVLVKMSQRSRQKLATDAEKLYACHQLWVGHNEYLATGPSYSVLNDAVYSYMAEISDSDHEDLMRTFFRQRIGDVGKLVRKVGFVTKEASHHGSDNLIQMLPESNRIILTLLQNSLRYREYNLGVYGIELPMINPWTSNPVVLDVVLELFDSTTHLVELPEYKDRREELYNQLPELGSVLLAIWQERLDWLGSSLASGELDTDREREEMRQRFSLLRPDVLETLRRTGHAEAAFALAEKYRDFGSLAALCNRETVYPPEQNPHCKRIEGYIERFKEAFAMELYRWYVQHGELRVMFAQQQTHDAYLDQFFVENPNTAISWIHDLDKGRYGAAAVALLGEAENANNLEAKHLMLSIGKLSQYAHFPKGVEDAAMQDVFHDELDFVSVHEAIIEEFRSVLESVRGRLSLESQIDAVVEAKGSALRGRRVMTKIFRGLVRDLLQGKALSIEDAVDVLTLKDNTSSLEDFATALHLLSRANTLPQSRKVAAFRTVWRRVYIHDDWDAIRRTANVTDAELNERFCGTALYAVFCNILTTSPPRQDRNEEENEGYDTPPDVALITPTVSEIVSRWPGLSPEQVETLSEDYNFECDKLGELDLADVYHRIKELAEQDVGDERQF